jgi:hypothetical protein
MQDDNFYCSGFSEDKCGHFPACPKTCRQYHRKHPTREQFKEEYGREWDGALYRLCESAEGCDTECNSKGWSTETYGCLFESVAVCACTPWGKPPSGWRPQ